MGFLDNIFASSKNQTENSSKSSSKAANKEKEPSTVPLIPEKEFGVQLVQLVEVALSDKILTTSERAALRELAIAKGVDLNKFEAYINAQKEKRGVKEIEDGFIPLKKYNQPTKVTDTLKFMIDIALADGYLSDEERKLILNEASKLGVNLTTFEAGLNAMFMTGNIKKIIDAKYPTTVTKRLISSVDTPDGKVCDTYEELTIVSRPNTNRGKENQIIRTTTKKTIKVTRPKELIEEVVSFLCNVDYTVVLTALGVMTVFMPVAGGIAVALVTGLRNGVDKYNNSGNNREPKAFFNALISEVSIDKCVEVLPLAQKYLGDNGNKIVSGLMTIHNTYKDQKK